MRAYESMVQKLRPLGIYRLAEGTVLDSELKAYAEGLDPLLERLEEMERESFIPTAEGYGLHERERFIDRERTALPVAERRQKLISDELLGSTDATAAGFRQYLIDCGLQDFRLTQNYARRMVVVFINDLLTDGQKKLITQKILQAAPSHLTIDIGFKTQETA